MHLNQLAYFVALAREQHFARAAEACFISQSTLSASIKKLESELGVELIHRGHAMEGITEQGHVVLKWAERILADHRSMVAELEYSQQHLTIPLRLSTVPTGLAIASQLVTTLRKTHPTVTVSVDSGSNDHILHGLRHRELDAGIILDLGAADDLYTHRVAEDRYQLLASRELLDQYPDVVDLAQSPSPSICLSDLAHIPLAVLSPAMQARNMLDQAMARVGVELQPALETTTLPALLAVATSPQFASLVPRSTLQEPSVTGPDAVILELDPPVELPLALAYPATSPAPSVAALLANINRDELD